MIGGPSSACKMSRVVLGCRHRAQAWRAGLMNDITYVGLDVHKTTICVAIAESGRGGQLREVGVFENRPDVLRKMVARLGALASTVPTPTPRSLATRRMPPCARACRAEPVFRLRRRRRQTVNRRHPQSLHSLPLAVAHHHCGNDHRWARRSRSFQACCRGRARNNFRRASRS